MYLRARDYGLRGLERCTPRIHRNDLPRPTESTGKDIQERRPVTLLTAAAWASAISLAKDDPALVADLPAVEALIKARLGAR